LIAEFFSAIRHPQFTTWILWAIAAMLVFQHWLIVVLGIHVIVCSYVDILRADKRIIERFGEDYKRYMEGDKIEFFIEYHTLSAT